MYTEKNVLLKPAKKSNQNFDEVRDDYDNQKFYLASSECYSEWILLLIYLECSRTHFVELF